MSDREWQEVRDKRKEFRKDWEGSFEPWWNSPKKDIAWMTAQ